MTIEQREPPSSKISMEMFFRLKVKSLPSHPIRSQDLRRVRCSQQHPRTLGNQKLEISQTVDFISKFTFRLIYDFSLG